MAESSGPTPQNQQPQSNVEKLLQHPKVAAGIEKSGFGGLLNNPLVKMVLESEKVNKLAGQALDHLENANMKGGIEGKGLSSEQKLAKSNKKFFEEFDKNPTKAIAKLIVTETFKKLMNIAKNKNLKEAIDLQKQFIKDVQKNLSKNGLAVVKTTQAIYKSAQKAQRNFENYATKAIQAQSKSLDLNKNKSKSTKGPSR